MNKTYYVCKYTPIELLESLGGECENFNHMPEGFDLADQVSHPNICGFGKTLLEGVMEGKIKELVLVSCCDTIRKEFHDVIIPHIPPTMITLAIIFVPKALAMASAVTSPVPC